MGNGTKTLVSFEDNRKRFVNGWTGPKSFEWKNPSIEVLSSDSAVVVTALFDWQIGASEPRTYSYTGLLTNNQVIGAFAWKMNQERGSSA